MKVRHNQKGLSMLISSLQGFNNPKFFEEQYITPASICAQLWHVKEAIKDNVIIDLGAGTGFLGISCLFLGAKHVYFVERDPDALSILKSNIEKLQNESFIAENLSILERDIHELTQLDFSEQELTIVQNPPFGTKQKHADRSFLVKSMQLASTIFSIHKIESAAFIEALCKDEHFDSTLIFEGPLILTNTMEKHTKKTYDVQIGIWQLTKQTDF